MTEILLAMLSQTLRLLRSLHRPMLLDHERSCPPGASPQKHENAWKHGKALETAIQEARLQLAAYAHFLEAVCDIRISAIS
jgi:hypothetical protein